jgi:cyanate lyase
MQLENLLRSKAYDVVSYSSVEDAAGSLETLVHAVLLAVDDDQDVEAVRCTNDNE